ncbi:MAG TPA: class I SAM-dependent methyltransferase [Thiobacillaceae bacterium]|nr:class I SAM-dependent methyltransferase [Thiobacillaceae bacterium]
MREDAFESVWDNDINDVFADVAPYYDRANAFATLGLGLIDRLRDRHVSTAEVGPRQKALDLCAETTAIGIGLLKKQPDLEVYADDRSGAMQEVGRTRGQRRGFNIKFHTCDVHWLTFPDNHFDLLTLCVGVQPNFI